MASARRRSPGARHALGGALTARQIQALRLLAQGLRYRAIARQMGITSTKTVEEHIDAARTKRHRLSRRECIRKAAELGPLWD